MSQQNAARSKTYFEPFRTDKTEAECGGLPNGLVVRPAQIEDLEGLARLCHERDGDSLETHREHYLKELTENPGWQNRLLVVAVVEGALVGYGRAINIQPKPDWPANAAPAGWYLGGMIVTPTLRRRGIGAELTRRRLDWIKTKSDEAFYFVNAQNLASIALHSELGFEELTRDFFLPAASFTGGGGILYRVAFIS